MNRPHVVVLHRWRGDYALYADYLSHTDNAVTYVTTTAGSAAVPVAAAEVLVIDTLEDEDAVREAVESLVARHGKPSGIVALKEDDLRTAATLRTRWGCPGPDPNETELFRDKYLMCSAVADAGHRVPPFAYATDPSAVREFATKHGWPVIIKPSSAHSSKGVVKISTSDELGAIDLEHSQPLLVQAYNPHPIYYVDGVLRDGVLSPWKASRYLNSCLDFRTGDYVGAVEEDDKVLCAIIAEHVVGFLAALTTGPLVFHLELFVEPGPDGPVCSFLEVGARAGGAEIPFLWRQVHGYDLMHAVAEVQLGLPPRAAPGPADAVVAGLLLVPAPVTTPCLITGVTPMVGRVPGLYQEVVAEPGDVVCAGESVFEQVAGRFRFRGPSTVEVERAILATLAGFHVEAEAL